MIYPFSFYNILCTLKGSRIRAVLFEGTVFCPVFFIKRVEAAVPDEGRPPGATVLTKLIIHTL